jgi:hypothetical protein
MPGASSAISTGRGSTEKNGHRSGKASGKTARSGSPFAENAPDLDTPEVDTRRAPNVLKSQE